MQLTEDDMDMSPEAIARDVLDSLISLGLVAETEPEQFHITEAGEDVLQRISSLRTETRELAKQRRTAQLHGSLRPA